MNERNSDLMNADRKILIFSANPKDTGCLRLDKEVREIQDRLRRAKHGSQFVVKSAAAVRIQDLQQELLEHEPHIVHFCGHGEEEGILVEDEQGKAVLVPSDALASLFALCAEHIECVLLNSCHSRAQAEAICQHIPYVIGMKKDVHDDAAVEFAANFYNALGFGKSIEKAFEFGKTAIHLYDLPDYQTPILLQRRAAAKKPDKIALLSASPLDNEQNWKPYLDELSKISCPIDHFSLSIDKLNQLQDYGYVLICSKVIKNKLLIENKYLCSERISFQELEENIGNEETAGVFLFVDQLPEEKFTAELKRPTLILQVEDKKHLHDILFKLFKKNHLNCCDKSRVLNPTDFSLCQLDGKSGIRPGRTKTQLPERIDSQELKNFIGRRDDLEQICRKLIDLEQGGVLTVKGAGGIGKTHTVKKIAAALAERGLFSGGIHFIDCEPITDSRQFQFKAAAVFGLEQAEDLWQHLHDHHDGQERLIIFDNFETLLHLDDAETIKTILSKVADYAKVVVTSREWLDMECETNCLIRPMTTDEAAALFTSKFPVQEKREMELLRQKILDPLLNNNPLAIKIITNNLPKGKSLAKLKEELENDLFNTITDHDLRIFDSGSDTNIDRKKSMYASILYSYSRLSKDEQIAFELLALFPDGINLEEFKQLTSTSEKQKKMPPLLITDRLVKSLDNKSMIENSSGHIRLQSIVGKFAAAMLEKREKQEDISLLYKNAFSYNDRVAFSLNVMNFSDVYEALEIFSSQQNNFLAAVKYCDLFKADKEGLLDYFNNLSELFSNICSLDGFVLELSGKIDLFQDKERQCAEAILLWSEYYNGDFSRSFAKLQQLLPLEQLVGLDRKIFSERLLTNCALDLYRMEGEALLVAEVNAKYHANYSFYPGALLYLGEYSTQLATLCQDDSNTFEALFNLGLLDVKRIDAYLARLYEKDHIERMQTNYTRAKLLPLQRRKIEPLVVVNPYTKGLKKLMLAFIETDAAKADALYRKAAEHLWHIRYYHVEALYFHAKFLHQQNAVDFAEVHQRGVELAKKHHYRFLQYCFDELVQPSGQPYDQSRYPLPDNKDFSEYINFLIKQHKDVKDWKRRIVAQRRMA